MPTLKSPSVARITRLTPFGIEVLLGERVSLADAFGAGRAAACVEALDGARDLQLLGRGGRLQRGVGVAGVGDDRDPVGRLELREQHGQRLLHQRQPVRRIHRTGRVDQQHQVGARARRGLKLIALDADADDLAAVRPRAGKHRGRDPERLGGRCRRLVGVREVVDQLLGAHRRRLRQDVAVERGAHERIGGGVHVDRERGDRRLAHHLEGILAGARELVAADIFGGGQDAIGRRRQRRRSDAHISLDRHRRARSERLHARRRRRGQDVALAPRVRGGRPCARDAGRRWGVRPARSTDAISIGYDAGRPKLAGVLG